MAFTPTLCGVTYDWDYVEQDRYFTPYRVPSVPLDGLERNFSVSYLEYLRSFYLEHPYSPSNGALARTRIYLLNGIGRKPYQTNGALPSPHQPVRSQSTFSWYAPVRDRDPPLPGVKCDGHQSCSLSLPSLSHSPQQWLEEDDHAQHRRSNTRLKWMDSLNAWVSEKQYGNDKPYITFVNSPPRVEKYYTGHSSREGLQQKTALQRKTAAEIAERRKIRKAYSTPVYTSQVQRVRVVRFQPSPPSVTTPPLSPPVEAWEEQREIKEEEKEEEVLEEVEEAEVEIKEVEAEVIDSKQEAGKDEKARKDDEAGKDEAFSRQMQSIALDTVETIVIAEVDEAAELESQITPHIKVQIEKCPKATASIPEPQSPSPPSPLPPPSPSPSSESKDAAQVWSLAAAASFMLKHRVHRSFRNPKSSCSQKVIAADAVDLGLSEGIVSVTLQEEHNTKSVDEGKSALKDRLTDAQKTLNAQMNADAKNGNKWKKALNKNSYTTADTEVGFNVAAIISETARLAKSFVRLTHRPVQRTLSRVIHTIQTENTFSKPKVQKHPAPSPKNVVKASKMLKKTPSASKQKSDFVGLLQPQPVSPPDEVKRESPVTAEPEPPTVPEPTTQVAEEITVKKASRSPIKKRERVVSHQKSAGVKERSPEPVLPEPVVKKVSDWIYNSDDDTPETNIAQDESCCISMPQPQLPSVAELPTASTPASKFIRAKRRLTALNHKPVDDKKRWGPKKLDTSYLDELKKQELAEERRLRQQQMYDRLHSKKHVKEMNEEEDDMGPNFDDYGFLAKYCIFSRSNLEMYRHAFNAIDDEHKGHLGGSDTMLALRVVNNRLTSTEEEYIYRILELTGYKVSDGADFKLFSVLAALSQRISSLDHWMKNLIGQVDFKILEMKTFMCKTLWECNVDPETNKISLHQLIIDLRAGGVSFQHQCEIQEKLSHLNALDLLDFLTYVPLFIMIHESVVDNPLDDALDK